MIDEGDRLLISMRRNQLVNGKVKGKVGELEFANLLKRFGFEARRGQQYCGANGDADVIHSIAGVHFEVKRVEKLNLQKAMKQASSDAKDDMPIVAHRCNRQDWLLTMKAEDFLRTIRAAIDLDDGNER